MRKILLGVALVLLAVWLPMIPDIPPLVPKIGAAICIGVVCAILVSFLDISRRRTMPIATWLLWGGVIAFVFGLAWTVIIRNSVKTASPATETPLLEDKIALFIENGDAWVAGGPEGGQVLLHGKVAVIQRPFVPDEQELHLGVRNDSPPTILTRVGIYIEIPDTVEIRKTRRWKHRHTRAGNKELLYTFNRDIVHGRGGITLESLFLTFPKAGEYPITYTITGGTTVGGFNAITRSLRIVLIE